MTPVKPNPRLAGVCSVLASLLALASLASWVSFVAGPARAAEPIRIGFIYDLSGPMAGGGSVAASIGTEIAVQMVNEKGGVLGKHKIEAIFSDAQSKPNVAINEAERLMNSEHVAILAGVYSSAQAVPLATKVDAQKEFFWITVAVSSAVLKDRHLHYVFRPQVHTDQFGIAATSFLAEYAQSKLGMKPGDLRVAIIHEDGPYGAGVAASDEEGARAQGMNVVLKEGYAATAPDLSSLVIKLKRARPDVILHTGYNPDITLFLRQARELGLRFKALVGHGAGYAQIDKLAEALGQDVNYLFNVDPPAAQLLKPATLAPGLGDLTAEVVKRYQARTGAHEVPTHVSMGFNNTWILLNAVLPLAITKYGGWDAESLRKATLDVDIPEGGTIQGYGAKFAPPEDAMAGQNVRAAPVVHQYVDGKTYIVYPTRIRTIDPVLPLPPSSPYALQ